MYVAFCPTFHFLLSGGPNSEVPQEVNEKWSEELKKKIKKTKPGKWEICNAQAVERRRITVRITLSLSRPPGKRKRLTENLSPF
jgi:hypothetical protein